MEKHSSGQGFCPAQVHTLSVFLGFRLCIRMMGTQIPFMSGLSGQPDTLASGPWPEV